MAGRCHCGCCEGAARLPAARHNAPGEPVITYRTGTHATFKASLLARLSSTEKPALALLRTRRDDDFTIATCDAAAVMLDVLTFYQERYANEFYLRTATERRSIVDLARLIGYQPSPGVAAGTHLMFQLEEAPGVPSLAAEPVTIAVGARVQSVPGPGEEPQTFETIEEVTARVEWNAIPAQTSERQTFVTGEKEIVLSGVSVQVQAGDVMLLVGDERVGTLTSDVWDARVVDAVARDNDRGITRVTLIDGLGQASPAIAPSALNPRAYVFRQRAALFGHNAPDPRLLFNTANGPTAVVDANDVWVGYSIQNSRIDLDASYAKIVKGSWVLLAGGDGVTGLDSLPGRLELYRADKVKHLSRLAFGLSGRITAITPDTATNLTQFQLQETLVFAQSEEVALAKRPLAYPLYGATLSTGRVSRDLMREQSLAVSGRRQRLRIIVEDASLEFVPDGESAVPVKPNDSFMIAAAPTLFFWGSEVTIPPATLPLVLPVDGLTLTWRLIDRDGRTGSLEANATAVELAPALGDDPVVRELCVIHDSDSAVTHERDFTTVELDAALTNVYDRPTVAICANIARATHGETVSEIAGSGNAATPGQRFMLKQSPLTYISAATTEGRASTLSVRVDGLLWEEEPSLFEQDPRAHVYSLRQDNDGRTIVQFGDGIEGARLSTGQDNIRFGYRKFLGSGGNLDAGRLTTLLGRPLGVKTVSNVTAASGGEDAESLDDARQNAPLTMLTLGRAVSLQDYTDFARSFAGIDKAQATWAGSGAARGIFVTVAGPDGAEVPDDSDTMVNLNDAFRDYGDPLVPLTLRSYTSVLFKMSATIMIADDADEDTVLADVDAALHEHYAFDQRDFGQTVSIDEVMAVIHTVTGVVAADVDLLYRADPGAIPDLIERLFAFPAQPQSDGTITPAELLTLDPGTVTLGVMPS
jgi:hypothetical protein